MLTKNFYILNSALRAGTSAEIMADIGTSITVPADNVIYCNRWMYDTALAPYIKKVVTNVSSTSSLGGVSFGNGTTPATINDRWLAGSLISNISWSSSAEHTSDDTGYTHKAMYTVTNTGSETITIAEVVLSTRCANGGSGRVTIDRTVLDEPITIEPGGVGVVTYVIRLNYPT